MYENDVVRMHEFDNLSFAAIGRKLSISRHAAKNAYNRAKRVVKKPELPSVTEEAKKMVVLGEREELRNLAAQEVQTQRILQTIDQALAKKRVNLAERPVRIEPPKGDKKAILLLSDMHYGMKYEINGKSYNTDSAEWQWHNLCNRLQELIREHKIKELLILDLGDDVDGDDMRVSQHRLIDCYATEQAVNFGWMLGELIIDLGLRLDIELTVHRVPGNHGRIGAKAGLGGLAVIDPISSYDWIAGEIARAYCLYARCAEIENHSTIHHFLEWNGHRILFEHGSGIGGSSSVGVPHVAIEKAINDYRCLYGQIDFFFCGHFHRFATHVFNGNTTMICNGAFAETSTYIYNHCHNSLKPCQIMLLFDKQDNPEIIPIYL